MRRVAQLSFDDARRKAPIGPPLTVLPDAARVEEHLVRRATPFVAGQVACTLLQLERELVRNARADGGALPPMVRSAPELTFEAILDWTPLRVRMVAALAARMRVRVRLPWSAQPDLREAVEPALRAFESLGGAQAVPDLELFDPADGSPLEGFLHALFGGAGPARGAPVTLRARASPAAPAPHVGRTCADPIAAGTPPDSIAIAARSLAGRVAEELACALQRPGIPWREPRRPPPPPP